MNKKGGDGKGLDDDDDGSFDEAASPEPTKYNAYNAGGHVNDTNPLLNINNLYHPSGSDVQMNQMTSLGGGGDGLDTSIANNQTSSLPFSSHQHAAHNNLHLHQHHSHLHAHQSNNNNAMHMHHHHHHHHQANYNGKKQKKNLLIKK